MPPASSPHFIDIQEEPRHTPRREPAGPIVGTVIIVVLLLCGILYFGGALLNKQHADAHAAGMGVATSTRAR